MPVYSNNNSIKNQKKQSIKNKIGIALICVSSVFLVSLLFNIIKFLNVFLLGAFGLFSYAIFISLIIFGIMLLKNSKVKLESSDIVYLCFWLALFIMILHLISSSQFLNQGYGEYIASCYNNKLTCGGAVFAILTYPVNYLFKHVVASVTILAIALIIISAILIVRFVTLKNTTTNINKQENSKPELNEEEYEEVNSNETNQPVYNNYENDEDIFISDEEFGESPETSQIILDSNDEDKQKAKTILGLTDEKSKPVKNTIFGGKQINNLDPTYDNNFNDFDKKYARPDSKPKRILHSQPEVQTKPERKLSEKDKENLKYLSDITGGMFGKSKLKTEEKPEFEIKPQTQTNTSDVDYNVMDDLRNDANTTQSNPTFTINRNEQKIKTYSTENGYNQPQQNTRNSFANNSQPEGFVQNNNFKIETEPVQPVYKQVKIEGIDNNNNNTSQKQKKKLYRKPPKYNKPPLDLLRSADAPRINPNDDYNEKGRVLEETMASFSIPAKVVGITKGPSVTQFELSMQQGFPVKTVQRYVEDIAMALQAKGNIRMEIPIPGKSTFGIEVPNESIDIVRLREVLESSKFQESKKPLTYALGKNVTGNCMSGVIGQLPHMLVAGSTGSGKSVCLNALLISLIYRLSPEDLKIILIDPKQVEFNLYNDLPQMLVPKVITDPERAMQSLDWAIKEMERRFTMFAQARVRNIDEYNATEEVITELNPKMPYIVIVVDEIGDLMLFNKKEIEDKIQKLTQKSRAAGIHLVVATQRPSVDVITGKIKANLPIRIAFAVASFADSKTIIDHSGAENLLGRGDMLYSPTDQPEPTRIQGAYVTNEEVEAVVEYIKEHNEADFDEEIEDAMFNARQGGFNAEGPASHQEFDPLMKEACRLIVTSNSVSTSKLQRYFGIGFPRAGKIIDQMEAAGFITPQDQKKLRAVLITQQEFEERFGEDL